MDALHKNISLYTRSSAISGEMVASGEVPIAIIDALYGAKLKAKGVPIKIVIPKEGIGWEVHGTAIIKGTDKLFAAKRLFDWTITRRANQLYRDNYAIVAYRGISNPSRYLPERIQNALIKNDFDFAARNRIEILEEWQARCDSKSERTRSKK